VIASPHEPRCVAVDAVALEITRHIPRLAAQRRLDPTSLRSHSRSTCPSGPQDKDLASAGVDILTTGELLDALRDAGHIE
jgi:hypothetical protein